VILCGLMHWILPQRYTKDIAKVHKGTIIDSHIIIVKIEKN